MILHQIRAYMGFQLKRISFSSALANHRTGLVDAAARLPLREIKFSLRRGRLCRSAARATPSLPLDERAEHSKQSKSMEK